MMKFKMDGGRHFLSAAIGSAFVAILTFAPLSPADQTSARTDDNNLVDRGRYLARAGNCVSCHTSADGQAFAGGLAFESPFGKLYSSNITPDPETGIGQWSLEEFGRALREGVQPDGDHPYPAFPYTAYTKISDADVLALYAYLKVIKPVKLTPPANEMRFPFNQRWTLGIWKALFFDAERFEPDPSQSAEWNRGAYLVEGFAHCSACHSPRNFLGAERSSAAMSGGEYFDRVASGEIRTWAAPNLTNVSNGLAAWSVEDVVAYFKTGRTSFTETHGPMNEVILNSTRHLSEPDVTAMAVYLKSLPGNPGDIGEPASAEVLKEGATLYDLHCGTCHQPTGLGGPSEDAGARLVGSPIVQASNPASLINVILHGPQLAKLSGAKRWKDMPAFYEKLADDEVAAIASYIRNAWGNVGGAVTEAQVVKQR
jgi:mono/diheme cytochrome c family protein